MHQNGPPFRRDLLLVVVTVLLVQPPLSSVKLLYLQTFRPRTHTLLKLSHAAFASLFLLHSGRPTPALGLAAGPPALLLSCKRSVFARGHIACNGKVLDDERHAWREHM